MIYVVIAGIIMVTSGVVAFISRTRPVEQGYVILMSAYTMMSLALSIMCLAYLAQGR